MKRGREGMLFRRTDIYWYTEEGIRNSVGSTWICHAISVPGFREIPHKEGH